MSKKIKIEINVDTWTKAKKIFETNRDAYTKLDINTTDDFIDYIIDNFAKSSVQFEQLSDQMKNIMENVDIDNLNLEDLFKNIAKSAPAKKTPTENKDKNENKKS